MDNIETQFDAIVSGSLPPNKARRFTGISSGSLLWVVGAINGDLDKLRKIHDYLSNRVNVNHRIVYTGNLIGYTKDATEIVDEFLQFRNWYLSLFPYVKADDIVVLRGCQEEMLEKIKHIHIAEGPDKVLKWAYEKGLKETIAAYGLDPEHGLALAENYDDIEKLKNWALDLTKAINDMPGHAEFYKEQKFAAVTSPAKILVVSTGLDVERPLAHQADSYWWADEMLDNYDGPYGDISMIIRGKGKVKKSDSYVLTCDALEYAVYCIDLETKQIKEHLSL